MKGRITLAIAIVAAGVMVTGCEDDDSPMQPGDSTITVVNATHSTIHVTYQTQTWDVLWPATDVSHEADKNVAPRAEADLSVHFDNELGTSRIEVTKDGSQKKYDVGFGNHTLTIREEDFGSE